MSSRSQEHLAVNSARIFVDKVGDPSGPPVVFLHGGAGSSEDFSALVPFFSDCRCILVDIRGQGRSTLGTEMLSYPLLASDVETIMSRLGTADPILIGHSDGGIAALHIAINQRTALKGIVTLGAHANPPSGDVSKIFERLTAGSWRKKFPEEVARYEQTNPEPDFDRLFSSLLGMWTDQSQSYPREAIERIDVPTLILAGDKDDLVTRDETFYLANRIQTSTLGIWPFGSHVMHQEDPALVAEMIRRWSKTLDD